MDWRYCFSYRERSAVEVVGRDDLADAVGSGRLPGERERARRIGRGRVDHRAGTVEQLDGDAGQARLIVAAHAVGIEVVELAAGDADLLIVAKGDVLKPIVTGGDGDRHLRRGASGCAVDDCNTRGKAVHGNLGDGVGAFGGCHNQRRRVVPGLSGEEPR